MSDPRPDDYDPCSPPPSFPRRPILWFLGRMVEKVPPLKRAVIDLFENIYYDGGEKTWNDLNWLGVRCLKYPTDLWIYQEIIHSQKPDVIIETGTRFGGSALFFASLLDLIDHGRVISIDIESRPDWPRHPRVTYIQGSSVSQEVIHRVESLLEGAASCMVVLDSDHRKPHVDQELNVYSKYVTPGQYLIVEDTSINGHPVAARFGPGPFESVSSFLKDNNHFTADASMERLMLSANHNGYLIRAK